MAIPKDRPSDEIDLDFEEQLDAVLEQRLSGHPARAVNPHRSSNEASSENITVRPPTGESGVRAAERETTLDVALCEARAATPTDAPARADATPAGLGLSWDYLRRQVPLSLGIRLRALTEVLTALGNLHTDLTRPPAKRSHSALWYGNLLFRTDGSALLLKDESVTPQPTVYVAPELRRGQAADLRVDIYAMGVMLLEALADQSLSSPEVNDLTQGDLGAHPFWGRLAGDPLLWVAVRATAREPMRRWQTASEFADALGECALDRMASREALGQLVCAAFAEQDDRATPLVSAPISSRGVSPLSSGQFKLALPSSPTRAHDSEGSDPVPTRPEPPAPPQSISGAHALPAPPPSRSVQAPESPEPPFFPFSGAADDEETCVLVPREQTTVERMALVDAVPAVRAPKKRRWAPLLLGGVFVLAVATFFGWRPLSMSLGLVPSSTPIAPEAPVVPGASDASGAAVAAPVTAQADVKPSAPTKAVITSADESAVVGQSAVPGSAVAGKSAVAAAAGEEQGRDAKSSSAPVKSQPGRAPTKPRSGGRYEPDGI